MHKMLAIVFGIVVLAAAHFSIYQRERLVRDGRVVLLELAPVDPRSLMQGDYMALRFAVANTAFVGDARVQPRDGHLVLQVAENRVATFVRFDSATPLAANEVRMRYRVRSGMPKFATNAFFFQEGDAERYVQARYGAFRVAADGEAILTELHDAQLQPLGRAKAEAGERPT